MSSVVDKLGSIGESITSLPSKIVDLVVEGIKGIFIPDTEEIKGQFTDMVANVERSFGLQVDSLDWLVNGITEEAITDTKADYTIAGVGTFNLTFLDSNFLKQGIEFFRPLIRGFVVFLLILYNYKQILTFIGQDPSIAHNAEQKYEKWRDEQ